MVGANRGKMLKNDFFDEATCRVRARLIKARIWANTFQQFLSIDWNFLHAFQLGMAPQQTAHGLRY